MYSGCTCVQVYNTVLTKAPAGAGVFGLNTSYHKCLEDFHLISTVIRLL